MEWSLLITFSYKDLMQWIIPSYSETVSEYFCNLWSIGIQYSKLHGKVLVVIFLLPPAGEQEMYLLRHNSITGHFTPNPTTCRPVDPSYDGPRVSICFPGSIMSVKPAQYPKFASTLLVLLANFCQTHLFFIFCVSLLLWKATWVACWCLTGGCTCRELGMRAKKGSKQADTRWHYPAYHSFKT